MKCLNTAPRTAVCSSLSASIQLQTSLTLHKEREHRRHSLACQSQQTSTMVQTQQPKGVRMNDNYNDESSVQNKANQTAKTWLQQCSEETASLSEVVQIGDFGCATGRNSAQELAAAISAIRSSKAASGKDVVIIHIDTPSNDWQQLFDSVNGPASYVHTADNVYSFATAKSFYEQVAPRASLNVAYSGIAFHWLSKGTSLSDHIFQHPDSRDAAGMEANRAQGAKDWETLLTHRAAELRSGGYLVATVPTFTPGASYLRLLSWAWQSWQGISSQMTEEEFKSFFIGIWHRTREELLAPMVDGGALNRTFEVIEARLDDIVSPPWMMYQQDKDSGKLALNYANYCMAIGGGLVKDHLKHRPAAEVESIIKSFHRGIVDVAADDVQEIKMPIGLLVLKRK